MNKILIIGQAPPLKPQTIPYDSTLLYTMLEWIDISKEKAQQIFEFDAIATILRGTTKNGHKKPLKSQIQSHFSELYHKACLYKKVIACGRMATDEWARGDFFTITPSRNGTDILVLSLPHPSRRNWNLIMSNKEKIIECLKDFID